MKKYVIHKGRHRSGFYFKPYIGKIDSINFSVSLNPTMFYDFKDADNFDVNKIKGISFGYHHKNSIRLGWAMSDDGMDSDNPEIQFWIYYYNMGERYFKKIGSSISLWWVERMNQSANFIDFNFSFKFNYNNDIINIQYTELLTGAIDVTSIRFSFPNVNCGYHLFPYFGGNRKAPHDVCIYIDQYKHTFLKTNNMVKV